MKQYTFELIIREGNDEFWEDIEKRNVSGCDEVYKLVKETLVYAGIDLDYEFCNDELKLTNYVNIED